MANDKERFVKVGLHICDFSPAQGPAHLGSELAALARTADELGFDDISVMDHLFQIGMIGPPELPMLEAYTTLGFLAAQTSRVKLLTLVTGVVYRHPGLLVKQVSTLDALSGGRAMLGIGAAWNAEEAAGLGLPFPSLAHRFERLEETLRVARQMFAGDDSAFVGAHYSLDRPINSPAPLSRPRPPILVGGGGEKKTLRLVAKYADACNLFAAPDVAHKLEVLREHCDREGRDYDEITKTCTLVVDTTAGSQKIIDQLGGLAELGFESAMVMINDLWRVAPLEQVGQEVVPAVAAW